MGAQTGLNQIGAYKIGSDKSANAERYRAGRKLLRLHPTLHVTRAVFSTFGY
jgi:hypothetical protein